MDINNYKGIPMSEFLFYYANLDGNITEEIISKLEKSKATHMDITELGFPYIKRVSFDNITEEDIRRGDVILVNDFKSNGKNQRTAPYIRPMIVKENNDRKKAM